MNLPRSRSRRGPGSINALFIWNCFEQIPSPLQTLAAAREVLARSGIIVIRTPDAALDTKAAGWLEMIAVAC